MNQKEIEELLKHGPSICPIRVDMKEHLGQVLADRGSRASLALKRNLVTNSHLKNETAIKMGLSIKKTFLVTVTHHYALVAKSSHAKPVPGGLAHMNRTAYRQDRNYPRLFELIDTDDRYPDPREQFVTFLPKRQRVVQK